MSRKHVLGLALPFLVPACGGGGGSSAAYDARVELLAITFPDPGDWNIEPTDEPPRDAPLAQQIVFTFSGVPDPNRVSASTLPIRDATGLFVAGDYAADGAEVTFTPTLPLRPLVLVGDGAWDTGGSAFAPASPYTLRVGPATSPLVASVAASLRARFPDPADPTGLLVGLRTTADPARFFGGLPTGTPQLVAVDPEDGASGVSPNLHSDPDHLFAPRRTFHLTFDRALSPDLGNLSDATLRLVDLDDRPGAFPDGLELGIDVRLIENEVDRAVVEVTPSGVLPFGHLLALERSSDLRSLSEAGAPSGPMVVAAAFTIAAAPAGPMRDRLDEQFDTTARQESDANEIGVGNLPAEWDHASSGLLQAAFAFRGDGVLGRFAPPAPPTDETRVVTLDTAHQVFPLPDGSTPDAPPGFEVSGGVFAFTDIDVPAGVVLRPLGNNPLVLTATGSVRIAGQILIAGEPGTSDNAYDSAVTSVPGGAAIVGGGRGGESHPIVFYPPDQTSYHNLVDPPYGSTGFGIDPADGVMKRIGGTGGECGTLDLKDTNGKYMTNQEIGCWEDGSNHSGEKVPGGGGGSMYRKGLQPLNPQDSTKVLNGHGNVTPDGLGGWIISSDMVLFAGVGGSHPFAWDGTNLNDFFGSRGQLTRPVGGGGGGGGATRTENYYCGWWCDHDDDDDNNKVCNNDDALYPKYGGSVGDARGGGGGGGGGVLIVQALGSITLESTAGIDAGGGGGGGGEVIGFSTMGGGGGGGAGGMIVLQSGTSILVKSGAVLRARGGPGDSASDPGQWDEGGADGAMGDGGFGGTGLIQLQVPRGDTAVVVDSTNSIVPLDAWVDQSNTLNPAEFAPTSIAVSRWWDMGRVTARAPANTNPVFTFRGLDANGYVATDADGDVIDPDAADLRCGYLGQIDPVTKLYVRGEEPRADFVPTNAKVRIEFQGANAIVEGSREVDPATITPWATTPSVADGMQFLRWRVNFDVTADGSPLTASSRRPVVLDLGVQADF